LEDEIDFLKKYIKLEEIRFKNKFEVRWEIDLQDESIEEIYIPTMLIQPLIENAIKYSSSDSSNVILIQVQIEANFLIVSITNSYDSRFVRTSKHKSTALTVIKERLKLYSKNNIEGRFELDLQQSKAVASIYIPI
jgi:sensor histidine kinase YesM